MEIVSRLHGFARNIFLVINLIPYYEQEII